MAAPSLLDAHGEPLDATTPRPGVTLGQLAAVVPGAVLAGDGGAAALAIRDVTQDSRLIEPGDLFAALSGARADGGAFVQDAVRRGAVAVLAAHGHLADAPVPCLLVDTPRRALAELSAHLHGHPTEALTVVGITGTNGKTTTTHLVEAAISAAGGRPGVIGTLGYRFGELDLAATHTSPEADALQRLAARMRARGADHLVMEVSSIALVADRVHAVDFDVVAFTNLTQDHLDYHGSMEAYAAAKDRLLLDWPAARAVINVDDAHGAALAARLDAAGRAPLRVSSRPAAAADVRALTVTQEPSGTAMTVHVEGKSIALRTPLLGTHNVENLLVALGIAAALGLDPARAAEGLAAAPPVAGRLERCDDPARDDVVVVVDYAHTPDALARALAALRPLVDTASGARLWCVFGCGGDRDAHKRGPMGRVVGEAADVAVVTNDNPRSEDARAIADAVVQGLAAVEGGASHEVELDRAIAIERTVLAAKRGDVILLAGKGHEPYQILGDRVVSFDDREQARAALGRRRGS